MPTASTRGNRTRKILSYFGVNFGLCPPYEVLCDGPVIFQSLKNDLYLKQSLPKLLGAPAYPVVTECVVKELRSLGDDYSNASLFAKRAKRVPCVHDGKVSIAECLMSRLRNPPNTGSIMATNDPEVSARATRVPGVAMVSILKEKKLILQGPSSATTDHVKQSQKAKIRILSDADRALVEEANAQKAGSRQSQVSRKKRKRAKGPNPLSVKKSNKNIRTNTESTNDCATLQGPSPPDPHCRSDKADEAALEVEKHDRLRTKTLHTVSGSRDAGSEEPEHTRKRRRITEPSIQRDTESNDPMSSMDKVCTPTQSGKSPRVVRKVQKRTLDGEQSNTMGTAGTDDVSRITSDVSAKRQGRGQDVLGPSLNIADIDLQRCIQQLPAASHTGERTTSTNSKASILTNVYSEQGRVCEEEDNDISFNHRISTVNGNIGTGSKVAHQLALKKSVNLNGQEAGDDPGARQHVVGSVHDEKVVAVRKPEAEDEAVDKSPHAMLGGRAKKHRKNRRRRPKKTLP